jgi:hypothetical protein
MTHQASTAGQTNKNTYVTSGGEVRIKGPHTHTHIYTLTVSFLAARCCIGDNSVLEDSAN